MVGSVNERVLIKRLKEFGFEGPVYGGRKGSRKGTKHPQMFKGDVTVILPGHHGSHNRALGVALVHRIIRAAHISAEEWDKHS